VRSPLLDRLRQLTEKQQEALQGVLAGDTETEISEDLQLSELETLRELRAVYAAAGVAGRHQLVVKLFPVMLEICRRLPPDY
jgi:FixJ family two-component response regulator